ncbi:hypothetical protein LOTGIDRAFT_159606 [Lottia gigantea]|uniref:Uncharacterized protein n=1 Tax=Lottia gigantea TaxID=225164 RepID=V4C5J3_LOTGI|nr:hypothetical protein LOTGIDRAFT_159606 [Lottia gigantea]ESO96859.1 hypothetical protein LOTGIDRAFT_159606 [Lottia gigantea]
MGRNRCSKWLARVVGVIASLSAICSGKPGYVKVPEEDHLGNSIQDSHPRVSGGHCESVKDNLLMFVSTLDGRVSVLDVKNEGQLLWSVQADARPLLSSSIGKLELNKDGVRTRLIPSLDGGLYQYDGDSIEAVPITAEKLLGSSFRLDDRTMMIGGKDTKSYGVDALSGQVRYVCGVDGCKFLGEGEVTDDEDIIVIKRSTQTVRAVESKSGTERWNFSVGHHELEFVDASLPLADDEIGDEDGVTITPCPTPDETEEEERLTDYLDHTLKIIVPEGMIVSLSPDHDNQVLWQHRFSSPVTNAWLLKKGVMKRLSLFDNKYVPALSSFQPDNSIEGLPKEPLLYVGKFYSFIN